MSRASSVNFPNSPLSRRVGVHTPSWVTFQEPRDQASNTVRFPEAREPSLAERFRKAVAKILCLRDGREDKFEMEVNGSGRRDAIDPAEAYKTKIQILETELERLNKRLEDLRRDYSRVYMRAQHCDSRCIDARSKYKQIRETYEDLARATYETYGEEQFHTLKAKIEEDKRQRVAKKRFLISQTMLDVTTEDSDVDSVIH